VAAVAHVHGQFLFIAAPNGKLEKPGGYMPITPMVPALARPRPPIGAARHRIRTNVVMTTGLGRTPPAGADDPWGYGNSLEWATTAPPPATTSPNYQNPFRTTRLRPALPRD
jgi:hypothetical protein